MSTIRPMVVLFLLLTLLTGVAYPLVVTGVGQLLFPDPANGSVITLDGRAIGSALIGQAFASPGYFWSRPSATGPAPYNAGASSGSNLGPLNPALVDAVKQRVADLQTQTGAMSRAVPVDLVTSSASGLDPHISPAAAQFQASRVAAARGVSVERVQQLVARHAETRWLGLLGEPRVNVLLLNLAIDAEFGRDAVRP